MDPVEEQNEIGEAHMNGEHFGCPEPACWMCWDDDNDPECPG